MIYPIERECSDESGCPEKRDFTTVQQAKAGVVRPIGYKLQWFYLKYPPQSPIVRGEVLQV